MKHSKDALYTMTTITAENLRRATCRTKTHKGQMWSHVLLCLPFTGTREGFEAMFEDAIEASESTRTDISKLKQRIFSKGLRDQVITKVEE